MVVNGRDSDWVVRDAEPGDAEACAGVHVRSWKHTYRGMIADAYLDGLTPDDRLPWWKEYLAGPKQRGCVLVVVVDGQVVGFASFVAHESLGPSWAVLPHIYLEPGAIGHGLGRRLIRAGLDRLAGFGYEEVELWVHPENARARRFYESGGWSPDGTSRTETVWGVEVPELRYVRSLVD